MSVPWCKDIEANKCYVNEEGCCDTYSQLKDDISGKIQIEKQNPKQVHKMKISFYRPRTMSDGRLCFQSAYTWGWGTPSPSHNTSTGPMSFLGGTPSPSHNTSTGPMSFLVGTPVTAPRSLPFLTQSRQGVPKSQVGGTPVQTGGTPGQGTPQVRTLKIFAVKFVWYHAMSTVRIL